MKKTITLFLIAASCLCACNNEEEPVEKTENADVNTVSSFIESALKGDYKKARTYMLQDSANEEWMRQAERVAVTRPTDEKKGLAEASINIYDIKRVNDSATLVTYANSYKKDTNTIRVLRKGDQWLVDLKYLFTHDRDSLWTKPLASKDSTAK